MRIAVSGASGLIGSALVPALEGAGHEVVRLVRREARGPSEISWDPAGGSVDAARLAGIDAAVNLSGSTLDRRWTASRKRDILESRVSSTRLLARTVASLEPRPAVFLSTGAVGIYGNRGDEILTEESELGTGFLAEVARAWEAEAQPARAAGIRVVNFRQGMVLSRKGGALKRMLLPFKLGVGGRVASGRQWWSWVSIHDLVAAYLFLLGSELAGVVNLTSPSPTTSEQFTNALGRALHRPTVLPVPAVTIKTLYGERGEAMILEGQRVLPARLLDAGFTFAYADVDDALAAALRD